MSADLPEPGLLRYHRRAEAHVGELQHRRHLGQGWMSRGGLQEKLEAEHQGNCTEILPLDVHFLLHPQEPTIPKAASQNSCC